MMDFFDGLPDLPDNHPVLIAGPTASGKSALAIEIARQLGGVIINADASQVFSCWRVITARPSLNDEKQAPHHLYGHVPWDTDYSVGHWLRDVTGFLQGQRPIIVGGTGLYFGALTNGLADIPMTPADVRRLGDDQTRETMISELDQPTAGRIDLANRARVQRAWEVLKTTGRGLADWQDTTPPALLPMEKAVGLVLEVEKDWLEARIARRFDAMLEQGALGEIEAMSMHYDSNLPAFRAIGVPELAAHLRGEMTLDQARTKIHINTRRFAKRQRTWFRSNMGDWHNVSPKN